MGGGTITASRRGVVVNRQRGRFERVSRAVTTTETGSTGRCLRVSRVEKERRGLSLGCGCEESQKFVMIVSKRIVGLARTYDKGGPERLAEPTRPFARQGPTPTNLSSRLSNPTSDVGKLESNQPRIPPRTPPRTPPTSHIPHLVVVAVETAE